jgi:hypothetical protein
MEKASKRFEDWEEVDCNECERWWINQCDGASKGSKKGCNSYLATRSIVIPERLNSLEKRVNRLGGAVTASLTLIAILLAIMGWLIG